MTEETRPNEFQMHVIERAAFLRGSIISSYSQVETLLVDLVLRCRVRRGYEGLNPNFPYKLEDRIKAVRRIFSHDGPLKRYESDVLELVDGLLVYEQIRHMMAHGLLVVRTHGGEWHDLTYRMYRPVKGGGAEEGVMATDLAQLGRAATEIGRYANSFVKLFSRIYLAERIEAV